MDFRSRRLQTTISVICGNRLIDFYEKHTGFLPVCNLDLRDAPNSRAASGLEVLQAPPTGGRRNLTHFGDKGSLKTTLLPWENITLGQCSRYEKPGEQWSRGKRKNLNFVFWLFEAQEPGTQSGASTLTILDSQAACLLRESRAIVWASGPEQSTWLCSAIPCTKHVLCIESFVSYESGNCSYRLVVKLKRLSHKVWL